MFQPAFFKPASMNLQTASLPKVTLTSAKECRPRKQIKTQQVRTPQVRMKQSEMPAMARAEKRPSLFAPGFVPAKATRDQVISTPAMLVVWQETYSDDGSVLTIQQSYWRVVVLKNVTPKEQLAKTT
jgi:hypothetical protein